MLSAEYVAGFLDGEGSVSLARIRRSGHSHEYCLRMAIYNTNRRIWEQIRRNFGGILTTVEARKRGWKRSHALIWTNAAAAKFLAKVTPYLRVKSEQAGALHEFLEHVRDCRRARDKGGRLRPLSSRELSIREAFYRRLKIMNMKGTGKVNGVPKSGRIRSNSRRLSPNYLAGFRNAEGCLMITRLRNRRSRRLQYRARIAISNTNRSVLEDVRRSYGGILTNQPSRKVGWKNGYQLIWADGRVGDLLSFVRPHLRVKRRHAALLLRFIRHRRNTRQGRNGKEFAPLSNGVVATREALRAKMRRLNAKGPIRTGKL